MRSRVRVWAAGAAVLGVLAVSACDPGDDPTDPPTTSAESTTSGEPTTSESPSDEVSTPPEVEAPTPAPEASVDDHVGAIYAARYFLDLYTYMRATGDTSQFEAMSAEECEFCASSIQNATEIHDGGGWVEGGEIEFDMDNATAQYPTAGRRDYVVQVEASEAPLVVHNGDGTTESSDATDYDVVLSVQYVDERFVVLGVNVD